MILNFRCKATEALFTGHYVAAFSNCRRVAERKLQLLDAATTLNFLRSPPGNRLEALSGDRQGRYSMRINAQFRLCFAWTSKGVTEVEIVDYH